MRCRQICPPALGDASSTSTRRPAFAARTAAAIPAGPAPTTTISAASRLHRRRTARSCLRLARARRSSRYPSGGGRDDLHSIRDGYETRAPVRNAVDRHAAFVARSHAAQRPARVAASARAKRRDADVDQRRGDADAGGHDARARPSAWIVTIGGAMAAGGFNGPPLSAPRSGANGAASIAGVRPATRSASDRGGAERRRDAEPFVTGRDPQPRRARPPRRSAAACPASRAGSRSTCGPRAVRERRHELARALEHPRDHATVHRRVPAHQLARRADEHLPVVRGCTLNATDSPVMTCALVR